MGAPHTAVFSYFANGFLPKASQCVGADKFSVAICVCVCFPNGSTANSLAVNTQSSDMSLSSVKGGMKQGGFFFFQLTL